jgi:predicted porin
LLSFGVTFAQATLYGNVDQAWNNSTTKTAGVVSSNKTGFAPIQMGGGMLGVKGSEDLAAGLKANYVIEMQPAIDGDSTGAAGMWNRQSFVGLSGAFGAVRIGKQYSNAFMNTLSVDPGGATGIAGNASFCVLLAYTKCISGSDGPLRQANSAQYDLPELVAGLKLGVTMVYGENDTANGAANSGTGNGFNLSYSSGALYAGYTYDKVKNTPIGLLSTTGTTVTYPTTTTLLQTSTSPDVAAASTSNANKLTTMSASYDLGMAKIGISNTKMSVGSQSLDNTFGSVSVPFGGNANVWASMGKGSAYRISTSKSADHNSYQMGVNYGLSKRTVLYAQYGKLELSTASKVEVTGTALGVHHSF